MPNIIFTGECTTCWIYGIAPNNFNETKHFLICPKCDGNMYLGRHVNDKKLPKESFLATIHLNMRPSQLVEITKVRKVA